MSNQQYTWKAKRFVLPQFQMLGFLLIIYGGYLAYQLSIISVLILLFGFALASLAYGNQIDFTTKSYRSYLSILGIKTGKWRKLPAIKYVNVYTEHLSQDAWVISIGSTYKYKKIKVGLVVNKRKHFDVGLFESKDEAMKIAKMVAGLLDTKLLDYTSKEPKWVDFSS